MPIHILAPAVANQIAAGEVVERPASAIKELIENSLDAGASGIRVEIREGGRRLIRVQDDGCGIAAADTAFLFHRHATSKIASTADLDRLTTLGFRGEALASIASVAQVTLATCARGEGTGTLVRVAGGEEMGREPTGVPPGTTITVEHLFANVPARLKFLKQAATESGHILQIVTRYALAYPTRRFSLITDGKLVFQSTGSGKLYDVLIKVYGLDMARQMLPLGSEPLTSGEDDTDPRGSGMPEDDGDRESNLGAGSGRWPARISVKGYAGVPSLHRSNRSYISLFVNGRWFQDNSLAYGVIQAYHTLLPVGRYPVALVFIEMDPADVDVNVHPAKAEVRMRDPHMVFGAVQRCVRTALTEYAPIPAVSIDGELVGSAAESLPAQLAWDEDAAWTDRRQALLNAGSGRTQMATESPELDEEAAGDMDRDLPAAAAPVPPDAAPRKIPILPRGGPVGRHVYRHRRTRRAVLDRPARGARAYSVRATVGCQSDTGRADAAVAYTSSARNEPRAG